MQDAPSANPVEELPDLPPPIPPEQKKSNKTWIIVLIVVLVLCCLCSCTAAGFWLWNNGDSLLEQMNTGMGMLPLI